MRAIIAVLDSLGVGATADADRFGDVGANTFGHIALACANGQADNVGGRQGPLQVPHLLSWGLGLAAQSVSAEHLPFVPPPSTRAKYGVAAELSFGKDTPSGHWEMAGLPVEFDWGYFPKTEPCFPSELTDELVKQGELPGLLGNRHASGTVILDELGEEHIKSGKPIIYTSADSVVQIAAHETHFGLKRLYELCRIARTLADNYNVGRVIARPFVGEERGAFERTGNRKDIATPPHGPTLLDHCADAGGEVIAIGKVSDIFAGKGITQSIKAHSNAEIFNQLIAQIISAPDRSIIFANFVDFDTLYGHRRNTIGYASALEAFDRRLPDLEDHLEADDIVILTADHGCDPTWQGSDHTREHVPVLAFGSKVEPGSIGVRKTFADIGQSLAKHLDLPPMQAGTSFL